MGAYLGVDLRGSLEVAFLVGILREEDLLGTLVKPFPVDIPTFLVVGHLDILEEASLVGILTFQVVASLVDTLAFMEEGLPFSTC